jgi:hypothetical protein
MRISANGVTKEIVIHIYIYKEKKLLFQKGKNKEIVIWQKNRALILPVVPT